MEALTWLARIALAQGREEDARLLLEPCAAQGYAPACYRLATLYFSWGDHLRASEQASTSLLIEPAGEYSDSARLLLDSISSSGSLVPLPEP
jgi:TPR repeat protein